MTFSGPSVHRCKCFGEEDGRDGTWTPCPPDLCEADVLLARAEAAERKLDEAREWGHRQADLLTECATACEAAEARVAQLEAALRACRELFVELRGDWSDNRGPCREGFGIIDAALAAPDPGGDDRG